MGRLIDEHKNYSILIRAFSLLARQFNKWDIYIAGDGPDREKYQRLISDLKLESRIFFMGSIEDTANFYTSGDVFCIPSHYEGFPMVAVEAQSYGLPLVGFSSCSGVNEIIKHGENGFLVEGKSPEFLAASLAAIMQDAVLRESMRKASLILNHRYEPSSIYDSWELLLKNASQYKNETQIDKLFSSNAQEEFGKMALTEVLLRKDPFYRVHTRQCKTLKNLILKTENELNENIAKVQLTQLSAIQFILIKAYAPFIYLFSKNKKYFKEYRNNPVIFLKKSHHCCNKKFLKLLVIFGNKL